MSSILERVFQDEEGDHPTHLWTAGIVLGAIAFLVGIRVTLGKAHAL